MSIADETALGEHYRAPHDAVRNKHIDHVDGGVAEFLAATTLIVLATVGDDGADASPRGGPPGFVQVLDPRRVAFADLAGNNRLDSYRNIASGPGGARPVGILGIVPGLEETLRLNGRATLSIDLDVRRRVAIDERVPKVACIVEVDECYIHCGKALRRAGVWTPDAWPEAVERPSPAAILRDHLDLDVEPQLIADDLEAGYRATLWEHGGQ